MKKRTVTREIPIKFLNTSQTYIYDVVDETLNNLKK